MRHTFYLLRKNLETIEEEAREQTPEPDRDAFIDQLEVSQELKQWMKRTGIVELRGEDFRRAPTDDEIMAVPEFRAAYVAANLRMVGLGFPRGKAKLSDRTKNPEKWEREQKKYWDEVRSYLELHPESREGLDEHLLEVNPGPEWIKRLRAHERALQQTMLRLIHGRYLAAQAETNFDGTASMDNVSPGRYWLTNLWNEALAGDVRLRWELPVVLRPGQTLRLALNNANAIAPSPLP